MKYNIIIEEHFARTVQVEAESLADAELAVRCMYDKCEIVLTSDDYYMTEFTAEP